MNDTLLSRKTLIYIAILLVLVGIFILQETVNRSHNVISVPETGETAERIEIETPEGTLSLQGGPERWTVSDAEYPADAEAVAALLDAIDALNEVDVISDRGQYAEYGLEPGTAKTVRISYGGDEELILHIGNAAAAGNALYARVNAGKPVVLLPRAINSHISIDPSDYRNRVMAAIPEEAVRQITISADGFESLTIRRRELGTDETPAIEETLWEATGGDAARAAAPASASASASASGSATAAVTGTGEALVSPGAFRNLFQELSSLQAQDFVATPPVGPPFARLNVARADGPDAQISLWPPDRNDLFTVEVTGNPYRFTIPQWRARRLLAGLEGYFTAFSDDTTE